MRATLRDGGMGTVGRDPAKHVPKVERHAHPGVDTQRLWFGATAHVNARVLAPQYVGVMLEVEFMPSVAFAVEFGVLVLLRVAAAPVAIVVLLLPDRPAGVVRLSMGVAAAGASVVLPGVVVLTVVVVFTGAVVFVELAPVLLVAFIPVVALGFNEVVPLVAFGVLVLLGALMGHGAYRRTPTDRKSCSDPSSRE